jgi:hypothetical protein
VSATFCCHTQLEISFGIIMLIVNGQLQGVGLLHISSSSITASAVRGELNLNCGAREREHLAGFPRPFHHRTKIA